MPPADDFTYDVFISYSHADEEWVEKTLLPRLEQAALRVCIDYRDFAVGKPAVINMEDAVVRSRQTLLVLTPRWIDSEWALFEGLMSRTNDPAGLKQRTIPLLLEKCEPRGFISILTWVNFTRPDRIDIAWTQLLTALGARPEPQPLSEPTHEQWNLAHPYAMPPNFTGRVSEREQLSRWLNANTTHSLLMVRALGGFGKSALTWHWLLHDVDPQRWSCVVWWSFYESEASFDNFLQQTLSYLNIDPAGLGPRPQADALLRVLRQSNVLLIMDGFERELRAFSSMGAAYQGDEAASENQEPGTENRGGERATQHTQRDTDRDCVSPIAEHFLRSVATLPGLCGKVLLTTRLRPCVLEAHGDLLQGCAEITLTAMQPADAVQFFRLQGVRGSRAEIERACDRYGYHPLSLRLLAGLIVNDLQQPGDIAAARRLDVSGDLVQRQHHVLEQSYAQLTPARRQLLSRIACFRGGVNYPAVVALPTQPAQPQKQGFLNRWFKRPQPVVANDLDADLRGLVTRGLLQHDRRANRYDLHPIVRRYAYDRLNRDERTAAHTRLRDYFAAVPPPDQVRTLDDLAPVIELYHHTVRAGRYIEARRMFVARIDKPTYYQFGAYYLQIELLRALFPDGESRRPHLQNEGEQSAIMNDLAIVYAANGQACRAVRLFEEAKSIDEKLGNKRDLAVGLVNLVSMAQLYIGALRVAEGNLYRSITLCREIEDEHQEASGHMELGRVLRYRGVWDEAETELAAALALFEKRNDIQGQGIVWAYRALRALLMARVGAYDLMSLPAPGDYAAEALAAVRRALQLADETARVQFPYERDYVRSHWLLGAAHRANGDVDEADHHLSEALTHCRSINAVDAEADILLDLARLRVVQGERNEARRLLGEALVITERSGYVLQGADVHLLLAEQAEAAGDTEVARTHARESRRLATCDGPPDYTYKVTYDAAGAMLARLGVR